MYKNTWFLNSLETHNMFLFLGLETVIVLYNVYSHYCEAVYTVYSAVLLRVILDQLSIRK